MRRLAPLAIALVTTGAAAHDADIVFVSARSGELPGEVLEIATLTGAALGQLAPIDADGDGQVSQADLTARAAAISAGVWDDMPLSAGGAVCARSHEVALVREGFVELSARYACGAGALQQDFRILRVLPSNFRVVLGSQLEGESGRTFASGAMTTLPVPRPPPASAFSRARLDAGLREGLAAALWLGALGALVLVLGAAASWRRGLLTWGLSCAGLALGSLHTSALAADVTLALVSVAVAAAGRSHPLLGLVLGAAIAGQAGGGPWSHALGVGLGSLGAVALVGPAALALGRLGQRRPRAWRGGRWAVAAGVCLAIGFRVAA